MRARLCGSALEESAGPRNADLIVVNSCTVTRRADQQVRQTVRRLHRENPEARIVVAGCYAERDPETLASLPGVSLVLGNADRNRLADILPAVAGDAPRIVHTPIHEARDCEIAGAAHGGKTRPFLKLQDGCDAHCSYCIVPSVRGPGRSAAPEAILAEIRLLVARGCQEIVLTGVHLGSYGCKLPRPARLADLLRSILEIPGLGRLRLSSIEPMRFDRSIVNLAAGNAAFAPHFHIPLQSGSDRILRLMRRPYKAGRFLDLLHFIHDRMPDAALGTDVLVGFPGETDEDFEATCELVRKSPLAYLHVFPFSAREGTPAASMSGQLSPKTVRARGEILRVLSAARNLAFRSRFVGQVLPAITLAREEDMGNSVVLTENYIHALIAETGVPPNRLIRVRIDAAGADGTRATLV
jgi:threonylcarbamoyladenosine tRNA methylthiotransferase MtaB